MSRTFAYCRVSTTEQTTENQLLAIRNKGYKIEDHHVVEETVSGSLPAAERKGWNELVNVRMDKGDTLIVLKLDRLGRDNIDVQKTVRRLTSDNEVEGEKGLGINLICLDLPEPDLSSSQGQLMMRMFAIFAEFERDLIVERTKAGLERAKSQGKKLGRPQAIKTNKTVQRLKAEGLSQSRVAAEMNVTVMTVKRHWNKVL